MDLTLGLLITIAVLVVVAIVLLWKVSQQHTHSEIRGDEQSKQFRNIETIQRETREAQLNSLGELQTKLEKRFGDMQGGIEKRLGEMSESSVDRLAKSNEQIQETLHKRLNEISGQVEKRLDKGFEKTTETFNDIGKRLVIIDEAQKKITELSTSVVSLQEVLSDKRSRGAFGEVQMNALIRNVMPENSFSMQHTLSTGVRVDCLLFLPEPTGDMAVDSKFPLDSYKKMADNEASDTDRQLAERQFKLDIKKHIKDISEKYIIPGETADGAIMFIPAEAVFAEIHAHQSDLVDFAHKNRVWMVSPTTLMAVLNTARAVLRDSATRKQVHLIQEHLGELAKDFGRFQERMNKLSTHIQQANDDVSKVNTSAQKISRRFEKIERVELESEEAELLESDD